MTIALQRHTSLRRLVLWGFIWLPWSSAFVIQSQKSPKVLPSSSRRRTTTTTTLQYQPHQQHEDLFAAVRRKEYEMQQVKAQHTSTTDPVRMAMSYAQETENPMRLARALRRVHEDEEDNEPHQQGAGGMRRASFIVDIKRKSALSHPGRIFCQFDNAALVAEAMVRLGADAVFINTDFAAYGGDMTELKSAVKTVRKISKTAAVVMKDIVVDEIQLGLAKEAGADGIVLQSCVLGAALDSFLDLATFMGLEVIVECHTRAEVERALEVNVAPTLLINNFDRIAQELHPDQAIQLAGLFPGSGGPIVTLACGGIASTESMKRHLVAGYDGVVVGQAVMGSPKAPEFIRAVRDRTLLPAELAHWAQDAEFDTEGQLMPPTKDVMSPEDPTAYQ